MTNPFSHIDLRVPSRTKAREFYRQWLPEIGFPHLKEGREFDTFWAEGTPPSQAWFGYTETTDHQPNQHRIAFWVATRDDVDRLSALVQSAGAINLSGPKEMPEYGDEYYGVFFDDPFGNALEIVHTHRP